MNIPFLDLYKVAKEPTNQLKYVLPYSFIISPGVCFLKNAALMTTYKVDYPDLESSSPAEIAHMSELFNQTVMEIAQEEGWAIYFDVKRYKTTEYPAGNFTNKAAWLIDQRRAENYEKYGEHFTTEHYITFIYQLPKDLDSKTTAVFFKDEKPSKKANKKNIKSMFQNNKNNLPEVQREVSDFIEECEKIMGSMSGKLYINHLNSSELFSYIKSTVSLNNQKLVYPEDVFFFLDNYICDQDIKTTMPLQIGEYYVPVMAVMDFPSSTYPAIFDGLNRTMTEFRWVTRFIPLSKEMSVKEAEKYQKRFYSARKSAATLFTELAMDVEIDRENQGAVELEAQANEIQGNLALNNFVLGYYSGNLMCWDKKLSVAKEKAKELQQVVRQCGFTIKEETLNNFNAWLGMMPGNVYSNVRRPLITSKNMSHVIPLSSAWQGMQYNDFTEETCGSGIPLCTCSTSYGTPFFLNLNVNDVGHTFIFGPTGAGKSTLLALLMMQAQKYDNANVIVIDKQLSSRAVMVASGGVYVEPGKDTISFQPLSELLNPKQVSEAEYIESILWCQQFIEGLLAQQDITINPEMSKSINECLKLLSEKDVSMHDLTSFQQYVTYSDPDTGKNTIRTALSPYVYGGQFGSIFDADSTNLKLSKLMTIEMGSLMRLSEKAVAPALMYIFRYLEKLWTVKTTEKQPLTFLFLDEAWLYLQHPIFAGFLQEWLRTLRKKKVFCIFATQEVSAAANSPLKDTLAQQCLTKIYLADENAMTPALHDSYEYFGLTEAEIFSISQAQMKRDYYFKNPRGCRMFSLDLDPLQLALISTDHEILDKVEKKYGKNTQKELVFELLEETKQKYSLLNKNIKLLDYSRYMEMLNSID